MIQGFKDWLFGMLVFTLLTLVVFGIGYFMNQYNHFSFLECWGLIMFIVVVRSGVLIWNEELEEDE
jgi:hypothetical protein